MSVYHEENIAVPTENLELPGILGVPTNTSIGVVLFAHGSGSGRLSPRNNLVARMLQDANLTTLLVDLLTAHEANDRRLVFDIAFLARRLAVCTTWLRDTPQTSGLPVGYFGASTGAAAALVAASHDRSIAAVVSRGGRPDLAGDALALVEAPTLLIVGGNDTVVLALNQQALLQVRAPKRVDVIPGATHLFEEPGTLEEVGRRSRNWFLTYLPR